MSGDATDPGDGDESVFAATGGVERMQVQQSKSKAYEKIEEDLEDGHAYGEWAAKEHAKEALEELYHSEFPIDDPPESFERYEAECAVRALRGSVEALDREKASQLEDISPVYGDGVSEAEIEIAKESIDLMATYGQLAEPHIAQLTSRSLPEEVRRHAIVKLREVRDNETDEPLSLREALGRWLLP